MSRTAFSWGIPLPDGFKEGHVIYVWFDALASYISGAQDHPGLWPADTHIIGKDITRFHCITWPAILLSAGLPLPRHIVGHGFVCDAQGHKQSKSVGNVVDPHDILNTDHYSADALRWYLCSDASFGDDLKFSELKFATDAQNNLANTVGNLVSRACHLCKKNCDGVVPDSSPGCEWDKYASVQWPNCVKDTNKSIAFDLHALRETTAAAFARYDIKAALEACLAACHATNKFLQETEPWKLKDQQFHQQRSNIICDVLEAVYCLGHFLAPFTPVAATQIFQSLNTPPQPITGLSLGCLSPGTPIDIPDNLFTRLDDLALLHAARRETESELRAIDAHLEAIVVDKQSLQDDEDKLRKLNARQTTLEEQAVSAKAKHEKILQDIKQETKRKAEKEAAKAKAAAEKS